MKRITKNLYLLFFLLLGTSISAQLTTETHEKSNTVWFSLGVRSTISLFDHDGSGLGTGAQFRIQINERVNTDWFADYISINMDEGVQSIYYHIGWSVLYYPFENLGRNSLIQPYILAGHCFDYNEKTIVNDPSISKSRWGSAVQAGLGAHFNINKRFDISLTSQYMIHFTKALAVEKDELGQIEINDHGHSSLEGHLLTTISLNYKIAKLWGS